MGAVTSKARQCSGALAVGTKKNAPTVVSNCTNWDGARFVGASSSLWWVPQRQTLIHLGPGMIAAWPPHEPQRLPGSVQTIADHSCHSLKETQWGWGLLEAGALQEFWLSACAPHQSFWPFWPSPSMACLSRGAWVWAQKLLWCSCGRCIVTVWWCGRWTCPDAGQHSLCWLCLLWCSSKSSGVVALC